MAATASVSITITMCQLSTPLAEIVQKAIDSTDQSSAVRFDILENALRNVIIGKCEETWDQDTLLADLIQTWKETTDICIHLLISQQMESCRKLPFLILEDIVEALFGQTLKDFWTQAKPAETLCQGVLWAPTKTNLHVLQFIKACNQLLKRFKGHSQWEGAVMLDLSRVLPLSDKSSMKSYGSVSGSPELAIDSSREFENSVEYSLYQSFWGVQQDFANPYKIELGAFINRMRVILSGLEGTPNQKTTPESLDYLTGFRIFPIQLHDASLKVHVLTQFLIIESLLSTKSPNLKSTLQTLANRAKDLLNKVGGEEYAMTLDWLLTEREEFWRAWKQNKCKPDFPEVFPSVQQQPKKPVPHLFANGSSNDEDDLLKSISMPELAKVSQEMGSSVPDVFEFLEDYKEALDPDSGIEAEYHPKNDKLFCWRAMRLLSKKYLGNFNLIQKETGDFENLVRYIYKTERNTDIPGQPLSYGGGDEMEDQVEKKKEGIEMPKNSPPEGAEDETVTGSIEKIDAEMQDVADNVVIDSEQLPTAEDIAKYCVESGDKVAGDDLQNTIAEQVDDDDDMVSGEEKEKRYAGMSAMERAMAEEEDQLEYDNRKRERQEAQRKRQEIDVQSNQISLTKKVEDVLVATEEGKTPTIPNCGDTEHKRKRFESSSTSRDVRLRFEKAAGVEKQLIAPSNVAGKIFTGDRDIEGRREIAGTENGKDDSRRNEKNSPLRSDIRRHDTQRDEPRGGRESRADFREGQSRGDQRREQGRADRRIGGFGGGFRDERGATGSNGLGHRDGEHRRGR